MEQVTIQTLNTKHLKPLLHSVLGYAIDNFKNRIKLTQSKLQAFEKRYGMSTAELERHFKLGDLDQTPDFIEWQNEIKTLCLLKENYNLLKEAKIND